MPRILRARFSSSAPAVWAAAVWALPCSAGAFAPGAPSVSREERLREAYAKFWETGAIREFPATPWDGAFAHKSYYYDVKTNTSPEVAKFIGTIMDAQAVAMQQIFQFGGMKVSRTNIWATREVGEFHSVGSALVRQRLGPGTGGFWTTAGGGTIVLPYASNRGIMPMVVLIHEATHQFLHAALKMNRIPIWVDEGLAVYMENSRYNPLEKKLVHGIVPVRRLAFLQAEMRADRHVRLADLIRTPQPMYTARHYGAGWSFIYWIFRSTDKQEALRRQKAFNVYLMDVKAGRDDPQRFFTYLGKQVSEIEPEWKTFVLGLDPKDLRGGTSIPGEPEVPMLPGEKEELAKSAEGAAANPAE